MGRPAFDAEYSATVLASHWFTGPEREELAATVLDESATTAPDRVEDTVLRFGPGVTAAAAHRIHSTLPITPPPGPRSGLRRPADGRHHRHGRTRSRGQDHSVAGFWRVCGAG
ncbi:hypothetical protein ACWET9_44050 [Streptomyces sp. NPDC004059]